MPFFQDQPATAQNQNPPSISRAAEPVPGAPPAVTLAQAGLPGRTGALGATATAATAVTVPLDPATKPFKDAFLRVSVDQAANGPYFQVNLVGATVGSGEVKLYIPKSDPQAEVDALGALDRKTVGLVRQLVDAGAHLMVTPKTVRIVNANMVRGQSTYLDVSAPEGGSAADNLAYVAQRLVPMTVLNSSGTPDTSPLGNALAFNLLVSPEAKAKGLSSGTVRIEDDHLSVSLGVGTTFKVSAPPALVRSGNYSTIVGWYKRELAKTIGGEPEVALTVPAPAQRNATAARPTGAGEVRRASAPAAAPSLAPARGNQPAKPAQEEGVISISVDAAVKPQVRRSPWLAAGPEGSAEVRKAVADLKMKSALKTVDATGAIYEITMAGASVQAFVPMTPGILGKAATDPQVQEWTKARDAEIVSKIKFLAGANGRQIGE